MKNEKRKSADEPRASRPHAPGYGIAEGDTGEGLLPWSWAVERLERARNYFLSTTRPDGRPHAMVIWGIWVENIFYFSTGRDSRKARNLAANPNCVVCPEKAEEAVIVEGVADEVKDKKLIGRLDKIYQSKYEWKLDPKLGPIYAVRPTIAFGFIET